MEIKEYLTESALQALTGTVTHTGRQESGMRLRRKNGIKKNINDERNIVKNYGKSFMV